MARSLGAGKLGTGGVAMMAALAVGTAATAAPRCARPAEVAAIQVAAVQQELMVAALTCNDVSSFNAFQTSFSQDLRTSDKHLQAMFRRLFSGRGTAEYHAFKTRLANNSSMRSIHDNAGFCQEAQQVFTAALAPEKPTLTNFVAGVAVHDSGPVDSCDMRVATGLTGTKAVPNVVPTPNPIRVAALETAPAAAVPGAAAPVAPAAQPAAATVPQAPAQAAPAQAGPAAPAEAPKQAVAAPADGKKKSGWFSSIFN